MIDAPKKGLLIGIGLRPAGYGCNRGYFTGIIDDVVALDVILDKAKIGDLMKNGARQTLVYQQWT